MHILVIENYMLYDRKYEFFHQSICVSAVDRTYYRRGSRLGGSPLLGGLAAFGLGLAAGNLDLDGDGQNLFQELVALIQAAAEGLTSAVQPDVLEERLTNLQ